MYNNYMQPVYSDELMHFGIKGMKWGVRHDKNRGSGTKKPREDYKTRMRNKIDKEATQQTRYSKRDYGRLASRRERRSNILDIGKNVGKNIAANAAIGAVANSVFLFINPALGVSINSLLAVPNIYYTGKSIVDGYRAITLNGLYDEYEFDTASK